MTIATRASSNARQWHCQYPPVIRPGRAVALEKERPQSLDLPVKRQHTTALVNVNSTVGRGSVGYDMNAIPAAAIEWIEVLRDGELFQSSVNAGFKLGEGFLNATLAFISRDDTERSGEYNNTVYLAPLPATRFPGYSFSVPLTAAEVTRQQQDNAIVQQSGFDRCNMIVSNSAAKT